MSGKGFGTHVHYMPCRNSHQRRKADGRSDIYAWEGRFTICDRRRALHRRASSGLIEKQSRGDSPPPVAQQGQSRRCSTQLLAIAGRIAQPFTRREQATSLERSPAGRPIPRLRSIPERRRRFRGCNVLDLVEGTTRSISTHRRAGAAARSGLLGPPLRNKWDKPTESGR